MPGMMLATTGCKSRIERDGCLCPCLIIAAAERESSLPPQVMATCTSTYQLNSTARSWKQRWSLLCTSGWPTEGAASALSMALVR